MLYNELLKRIAAGDMPGALKALADYQDAILADNALVAVIALCVGVVIGKL